MRILLYFLHKLHEYYSLLVVLKYLTLLSVVMSPLLTCRNHVTLWMLLWKRPLSVRVSVYYFLNEADLLFPLLIECELHLRSSWAINNLRFSSVCFLLTNTLLLNLRLCVGNDFGNKSFICEFYSVHHMINRSGLFYKKLFHFNLLCSSIQWL